MESQSTAGMAGFADPTRKFAISVVQFDHARTSRRRSVVMTGPVEVQAPGSRAEQHTLPGLRRPGIQAGGQ